MNKLFTDENDKCKAYMSIILDGCYAVHGIALLHNDTVHMPNRKDNNGKFHDIIHPLNDEARKELDAKIIDAYYSYIKANEKNAEIVLINKDAQ